MNCNTIYNFFHRIAGRWSFKRSLLCALFIGCLWLPLRVQGLSDFPSGYPLQKVLIVYSQRYIFGYVTDYVQYFGLLLKHFHTEIAFCDVRNYRRGQMDHYDQVFYLGLTSDSTVSDVFLTDAAKTKKRLCWMGYRIENLLKYRPDLGLQFQGYSREWVYDDYLNHQFVSNPKMVNSLLHPMNGKPTIWARISNGDEYRPYALSVDNVWIFSRVDLGEDSGKYIMADLLHEVLHENHPAVRRAFIRIEDLHPLTEVSRFQKIVKIFARYQVPFMMAVIPAYSGGKNSAFIYLSDRPKLAGAIRDGIHKRGSVILHGFTHQNNHDITGEGFEFWDSRHDRPLGPGETGFIGRHLDKGIQECLKNGILPLAFEPAHYAMSQRGYLQTAERFSTLVAQIQTSDQGFSTSSFPFVLYNTYCGQFVIPENLSYVDPSAMNPLLEIQSRTRKLEIVRDAMAGVFFHPYVDPRYLETIIQELSNEGYQFFDLRVLPNWVRLGNRTYSRSDYQDLLAYSQKRQGFLRRTLINTVRIVTWIIVVTVAAVCCWFLFIYLRMRHQESTHLFEKGGQRR